MVNLHVVLLVWILLYCTDIVLYFLFTTACQYTCHQHCVPAVTLNCKSVSEDSVQVKTPTPTEPRPQLETSLSLGNIHARPGCARSVTLTNSQGSSLPTQQHPRICSPHIAQGTNSQVYVPGSSSSPLLARSASEGYVTAQLPGGISRPTTLSSATESSSHPIANANPQTLVQSSSSLVDNVNVTGQLSSSCQVSSSHNVTHHITEQDVTLQLHGPEVNSEEATVSSFESNNIDCNRHHIIIVNETCI